MILKNLTRALTRLKKLMPWQLCVYSNYERYGIIRIGSFKNFTKLLDALFLLKVTGKICYVNGTNASEVILGIIQK